MGVRGNARLGVKEGEGDLHGPEATVPPLSLSMAASSLAPC
jgi:hypothetical protein